MIHDVMKEADARMVEIRERLKKDYISVRTGRANAGLVDSIKVDYYGNLTPLRQIASVAVPEASLIIIQPWDISLVGEIEKALLKSELGLTPSSDGKLIRLAVPPLSEERRKDLVKVVKKMAEEARVAVRNIRRDANDQIKDFMKEKEISEDSAHKGMSDIQKTTERFIVEIDKILAAKEKEVFET